jgi:Hemopexin
MTAKRVYFFSGTEYSRFDVNLNLVNRLVYPVGIAQWWPGLPAGPIDTAVNWGLNRVYFFAGPNYYRWNVLADRVDPGYPKPIAGNWAGFAGTGFENGVDAAVNWGNGKIYFFKGGQYLRMDWATSTVDPGYPKSIGQAWSGLSAIGFDTDLDDVINFGNGKVYLFKGSQYARFDIASNTAETGYPKAIDPAWAGVFPSGISAAVEWPYAQLGPGGFRVPVNRTGCQDVPQGAGRKGGEQFDMQLDYAGAPYPMSESVGEYRQYVRGSFAVNGTALVHGLPGVNPGDPPRTMMPTPAAGSAVDNFLEDGLVTPPAGANVFYGHRLDVAGNSDTTDQFLPDRIAGGQYRGNDFPGISTAAGNVHAVNLDFLGQAVDSATSGEVLQSANWSVNCAGVL